MGWRVAYEPKTGELLSFYNTEKHKDIPEASIDLDTADYLKAAWNRPQFKVDPETKTLQRIAP